MVSLSVPVADRLVDKLPRPDKAGVADKLLSKSKNTPFDGRLVQGAVLRTVVDGRTVYVAD